jgi:hypothetical protein
LVSLAKISLKDAVILSEVEGSVRLPFPRSSAG